MKEMENRDGAQGASKGKANPGKATIFALGKAFTPQLVLQDYRVDGYFKDTSCDDIDLKQKLTRLCKTTTVKTRYVVMSEEILKKYPRLVMEGQTTIKQILEMCNKAVTYMAIEASQVAINDWGRLVSDITHLPSRWRSLPNKGPRTQHSNPRSHVLLHGLF